METTKNTMVFGNNKTEANKTEVLGSMNVLVTKEMVQNSAAAFKGFTFNGAADAVKTGTVYSVTCVKDAFGLKFTLHLMDNGVKDTFDFRNHAQFALDYNAANNCTLKDLNALVGTKFTYYTTNIGGKAKKTVRRLIAAGEYKATIKEVRFNTAVFTATVVYTVDGVEYAETRSVKDKETKLFNPELLVWFIDPIITQALPTKRTVVVDGTEVSEDIPYTIDDVVELLPGKVIDIHVVEDSQWKTRKVHFSPAKTEGVALSTEEIGAINFYDAD